MLDLYLNTLYIEAKEAVISKQLWTPEQKSEIQELVNKYPQKASTINWQAKELKYEDVLAVLKEESKKQVKKIVRAGLQGLTEGEDFIEFHDLPMGAHDIRIFAPLNHKGSCTIGRGSRWCTTEEKSPGHWKNYIKQKVVFFYLMTSDDDPDWQKIAISWNMQGGHAAVWDAKDQSNKIDFVDLEETFGVPKDWFARHAEIIRDKLNEIKLRNIPKPGEDEEVIWEENEYKLLIPRSYAAYLRYDSTVNRPFLTEDNFEDMINSEENIYILTDINDVANSYFFNFQQQVFVGFDQYHPFWLSSFFTDNPMWSGALDAMLEDWGHPIHSIEFSEPMKDILENFYYDANVKNGKIPGGLLSALVSYTSKEYKDIISECDQDITDVIEYCRPDLYLQIDNEWSNDEFADWLSAHVNIQGIIQVLRDSLNKAIDDANQQGPAYLYWNEKNNRAYSNVETEEIYDYDLDGWVSSNGGEEWTFYRNINGKWDNYGIPPIEIDNVIKDYEKAGYESPEEAKSKLMEKEYKKAGQKKLPGMSRTKQPKRKNLFEEYIQ